QVQHPTIPPHRSLDSNQPADEEIRAVFGSLLPELPTNGEATATTATVTATSATAWQLSAPLPRVITASAVLLPDFAMELQRQEDLSASAGSSGLKIPSSDIEDDPLICDIIKRLNHQEIQRDSSATMETATIYGSVMRTEKLRFTREEKGKAIRFSDAQGQKPQGHKSTTSSSKECNGAKRRTELLQGECSQVGTAGSNYSPSFQPAAMQGSKEGHQQHENLHRRLSARSQQNNTLICSK
ncbi:unnamed protein product, partial [Urochloa humidicola]